MQFKYVHTISLNICFSDLFTQSFSQSVPHSHLHTTAYLSINPERASLLIQLYGSDTCNFPCLLDVAAMTANGQAHQICSHYKLLLEG